MEWVRGEIIGHGSFASVSLAKPRNQSSKFPPLMAVKSCSASHSVSLMKEKSVLEKLSDCPEIITCFGDDFSFEYGEKLYNVLLEYASGGNLADKLKKSGNQRFSESETRQYTKAILRGLDYVHKNGYVHCDIKLQNILLSSNGIKIADFGLAKEAGLKESGYELRGTPLYMSPEIVNSGEQEAPSDIWALGCMVSEMVSGTPAWNCRPETDISGLLMRIGLGDEVPEIPGKLTEQGKDFLGKCFLKNPEERWTAEMLLNHPFLDDQHPLTMDDTHMIPSTSPTSAFDFPTWRSVQCFITSLPLGEYSPKSVHSVPKSDESPVERLRRLMSDRKPDLFDDDDKWVTVR